MVSIKKDYASISLLQNEVNKFSIFLSERWIWPWQDRVKRRRNPLCMTYVLLHLRKRENKIVKILLSFVIFLHIPKFDEAFEARDNLSNS